MWELACVCVHGRKIRERERDGAIEIERLDKGETRWGTLKVLKRLETRLIS